MKQRRQIICRQPDGKEIRYPDIYEAAAAVLKSHVTIYGSIRTGRPDRQGNVWRYATP